MSVAELLYEGELYQTIWQAFPILVVSNTTGEILKASPTAELVFGFDVLGGMSGHKVEDLIPEDLRTKHVEYREAYAKDPYPRMRPMGAVGMTLLGRRKNGETFPVEILLRPAVIGAVACTLVLVADLSGKLQRLDHGHGEAPHA